MGSTFCDAATLVGFGGTGGGDTKPFGSSGRVVRKGLSNGVDGGRAGFAPALLLLTCLEFLRSSDRVDTTLSSGFTRSGDDSTCAIDFEWVASLRLAWRLGGGGSGPEDADFVLVGAVSSFCFVALVAPGDGRC
jgi:hypothetical protein